MFAKVDTPNKCHIRGKTDITVLILHEMEWKMWRCSGQEQPELKNTAVVDSFDQEVSHFKDKSGKYNLVLAVIPLGTVIIIIIMIMKYNYNVVN